MVPGEQQQGGNPRRPVLQEGSWLFAHTSKTDGDSDKERQAQFQSNMESRSVKYKRKILLVRGQISKEIVFCSAKQGGSKMSLQVEN